MENKLPQKLTRTLLFLNSLTVRIHIKIIDKNYNFHNEFSYGNKTYLKLDPSVYLSLDMKDNEEGFTTDKSIWVNQMNINSLLITMKKVIKHIYEEKIFAKRGEEIVAYKDMVEKYTEKIVIPHTDQVLMIKPAVIYDENETSYEGVNIYLNKLENVIALSIDEFETLLYTMSKVDLFTYSQLLLNYIAIKYPNGYIENNNTKTYKPKTNIKWEDNSDSKVQCNFKKSDNIDIFKGLNSDDL